jgi:hypothetical protein
VINVKKNELTKVVMAALVLASSSVLAASDYPAADFQPKVLYSDENAQSTPKAKPAAEARVEAADPNFPAANYQPKVLFSDADYKHSAAAPSASGASKSSVATPSSAEAAVEVIQNEKAASSDFSLIGLVLLAVVGFVLYNKKSGQQSASAGVSGDYIASTDGSTGVEKYLEKMGANKTGVAKYLEKQTENPSTGVAKYMAKQIVKDREAAASRATGVEKYLREKG